MADEILDGQEPEDGKVVFTLKQQERVNELIREKQGEAAKSVRAENAAKQKQIDDLNTKMEELRNELSTSKRGSEGSGSDTATLQGKLDNLSQVAKDLQSQLETERKKTSTLASNVEAERQKVVNIKRDSEILAAAGKVGFVDPKVVAKLTAEFVKWDDERGRFIVTEENGQPKYNASLEPMSLEEFYSDYAAKTPYLVKPDARPGTGGTASQGVVTSNGKHEITAIFGPKSDAKLANKLAQENPVEYKRLKALAIGAGLI